MNLGEFENGKARQPLPPCWQHEEPELDRFQRYCNTMMLRILTLFAIGLEVSPMI